MHRFRQPLENKFGIKPPLTRINFNTIEKSIQNALPLNVIEPQSIWEVLGITEEEYYQQYHRQPVNENAMEIQDGLIEEKTQEPIDGVIMDTSVNIIPFETTAEPIGELIGDASANIILEVSEA